MKFDLRLAKVVARFSFRGSEDANLAKSRRRLRRFRELRIEELEDRSLLSVDPIAYAEIRAAYPELDLPAEYGEISVVEPVALDAAALQAAFDEAATTPTPDVVLIDTAKYESSTLNLEDATITIDVGIDGGTSVWVVAVGSERLKIGVDSASPTFWTRSGAVSWTGVDFVGVADTNYIWVDARYDELDDEIASWTADDARYYDADGNEISPNRTPRKNFKPSPRTGRRNTFTPKTTTPFSFRGRSD